MLVKVPGTIITRILYLFGNKFWSYGYQERG
jgi:hypothetical protein